VLRHAEVGLRSCPLLFCEGGYLDLHNFRNRNWKPAQRAAGIEPLRRARAASMRIFSPVRRASSAVNGFPGSVTGECLL
jgi:hypothetical protein